MTFKLHEAKSFLNRGTHTISSVFFSDFHCQLVEDAKIAISYTSGCLLLLLLSLIGVMESYQIWVARQNQSEKAVKIPAGDFPPLCSKVHADSSVPERVNKTM